MLHYNGEGKFELELGFPLEFFQAKIPLGSNFLQTSKLNLNLSWSSNLSSKPSSNLVFFSFTTYTKKTHLTMYELLRDRLKNS